MKHVVLLLTLTCALSMLAVAPAWAAKCPPDSVEVGPVCVDKYEASIWSIPATNTVLSNKVKKGVATLAQLVADRVLKADAQFVRQATGFAIGGVPPVGHPGDVQILLDASLLQYPEIWAAAGTPHAVFRLSPEELKRITGGRVVSVA